MNNLRIEHWVEVYFLIIEIDDRIENQKHVHTIYGSRPRRQNIFKIFK